MPSNLSLEARIAMKALVLVERGLSEKTAVAETIRQEPDLMGSRNEGLKLVLETVAKQDLLDSILFNALPSSRLPLRERCLARLTAILLLKGQGHLHPETLRTLRGLAPDGFRQDLEYLLGFTGILAADSYLQDVGDVGRTAIESNNSSWWVDYCFRTFGRSEAVRLLTPVSRPRYVRVNSLRNGGRTSLPRDAVKLMASFDPIESFPGIYRFMGSPASISPLLSRGLFQFQDLASYLAVLACAPRPGDSVLDLCSAPGAKTCAIAQGMKNRGRIVSVDYSRVRMKAWIVETRRLGVSIANPLLEDVSRLGMHGSFDLVLLDPPCSGTGILDRNPRMKWHLTRERVRRYSELQSQMLQEAYRFLAPGGRLVYCTCSLTVEENEEVVAGFLRMHPEMEARPIPLDRAWGSPGLGLTECRRFFPHRDETAGYFIARLELSG